MSTHVVKPIGQVALPGFLCGLAGAGLAIGLDVMGVLGVAQQRLTEVFQGKPFYQQDFSTWAPHWDWALGGVLAILVALAVLDSPGAWRRFFVGFFALVLLIGVAPLLVLWGKFWSPVVPAVAVIWSWFCAVVYSSQHRMPCDIALHLGEEHIHLKTSEEIIEEVVEEEHIRVETVPFPLPVKKQEQEVSSKSSSGTDELSDGVSRWKPNTSEEASRKEG
ncbi:hypothetical protein SAMN02745181_2732 [Rubritalea squalenifaciens DSM 18772]|uniref:Uncharacterized protein n=1 Tax=Rubritalea squalenifaciens DSM 18772 TaxID=1123071 RepID=A0A1M6MHQ1_9BACT|nr:hypothetical protein [Rubritalea squalenifaciens]SHJ82830.1 hypothetical protein SAMN02745181_2732 [Rubritalea squalenifaciens DSM 18772]